MRACSKVAWAKANYAPIMNYFLSKKVVSLVNCEAINERAYKNALGTAISSFLGSKGVLQAAQSKGRVRCRWVLGVAIVVNWDLYHVTPTYNRTTCPR